jgi:signal transduction histidine kinase
MKTTDIEWSSEFRQIRAEDRRKVVIDHAGSSLLVFFPVVAFIGVMEWITRPSHRTAVLIVGALYLLIAMSCLALLRLRPQRAIGIAVGGVSAMSLAMLSYSPMVDGSGELCVLALTVLIGGFAVAFPLGLSNQLLVSIVPIIGYAAVLQLGTTTAYPVWYSASALIAFLFVVAVGAHASDQYRVRILLDGFRQATLAAENERLRDEARAADRAKTDLMSMLSHELRASLGTIQILSEMLVDGGAFKPQEWPDMLERIHGQSQRALDLVHTMLEFGRVETGELHVAVDEIDLFDLFADIRAEIPETWALPGVSLIWRTPPKGIIVHSDRGKLEAIVRNLVHNALRHTRAGSVTVMASLDAAWGVVRLTVSDTGEGIANDDLPRIFERFARATSSGEGFGLGLFIVRRFTEALGGRVSVISTPTVGTRFEVVVPREPPAAHGTAPIVHAAG